ncbi:endo alpha-1,4 polygalactosaminidase [Actinobaculum sp. 352]|uniref:endo alpha-1,4 polygalactosaminidase n=1 Tax=Actinobaculum sp. 352 TaxID=2490946 RepID=UPI000F7FA70B|nr:endo alpha-1,4 polygalactosaminidase [Actinobaculum sp. 352]RTE49313.1 hypothetical protein EKN07_07035 [Actinobaculum sp. 352]
MAPQPSSGTRPTRHRAAVLLIAAFLLACCTPAAPHTGISSSSTVNPGATDTPHTSEDSAADVTLPPTDAQPDYQLAGAYTPDPAVGVVGRDHHDPPAGGLYSICYINGFQTQPEEREAWPDDLLLHADGAPLADPDWPDEVLLDTSSSSNREKIAAIVEPWIEQCARDGFNAVEFDNLDSYTRSGGALSLGDNLAQARLFVQIAHREGLAAGQKNSAEASRQLHDSAGFDFAVVEECMDYNECQNYTAVYGNHVIDIEYVDEETDDAAGFATFEEYCHRPDAPSSMVLRDRNLSSPGSDGYVFRLCEE